MGIVFLAMEYGEISGTRVRNIDLCHVFPQGFGPISVNLNLISDLTLLVEAGSWCIPELRFGTSPCRWILRPLIASHGIERGGNSLGSLGTYGKIIGGTYHVI